MFGGVNLGGEDGGDGMENGSYRSGGGEWRELFMVVSKLEKE